MKIIVKAAHYIQRSHISRAMVHQAIVSMAYPSNCGLLHKAHYALYWKNAKANEHIFDSIYPQCSEEDERILQTCLKGGAYMKIHRSKVALSVEPSMTVSALKSLLKTNPWIPKKNFLLVQKEHSHPLDDDSSTLDDCGIKEDSVLLACMGGSFPLTIHDYTTNSKEEFVIPVGNCFETIGDLKKRIHQKTGRSPDDHQALGYESDVYIERKHDDLPLFACGIVKVYLRNMQEDEKIIDMMWKKDFDFRPK